MTFGAADKVDGSRYVHRLIATRKGCLLLASICRCLLKKIKMGLFSNVLMCRILLYLYLTNLQCRHKFDIPEDLHWLFNFQ